MFTFDARAYTGIASRFISPVVGRITEMPGLITNPGKIRLAVEPVHMRRGIAGLSMVVQQSLEYTPCAGSAFVFCNRSNNRIKVDEVEVFLKNQGKQRYLWRAIEQDGEVADVSLRALRDGKTAKRFFKQFLKKCRNEPKKIVTDKLRNYGVAHRELVPDTIHDTSQHATIVPSFNTNQPSTRYAPVQVYGTGTAILEDPSIFLILAVI